MSSLYVLEINPLPELLLTNICLSVFCLLIVSMVFFDMQTLQLDKVLFVCFFFCFPCPGRYTHKYIAVRKVRDFTTYVFF